MSILYLLYDGDCILCRNSAQAVKIKETVGQLEIINARTSHPLVIAAIEKGYDLNEGILVQFDDQYYHGVDALHFLALISSSSNLFNRLNHAIFKHAVLAKICYPIFKFVRNSILYLRGISQIKENHHPTLHEQVFGSQINQVPNVIKACYSPRFYSSDRNLVQGAMTISVSKFYQILSPLFKLAGALVYQNGENIPTSVEFVSSEDSNHILMHRRFYFDKNNPQHFCSKLVYVKDNIVMEVMKFGFATRLLYRLENNTIFMDHGGFGLQLGRYWLPLPLALLIGKVSAYEQAISAERFNMQVKLDHFLFGTIFQYHGYFELKKRPFIFRDKV